MHTNEEKTTVTLANAAALASAIMIKVAGSEVSATLSGTVVSRQTFDRFFMSLVTSRMTQLHPNAHNN